MGICDLINFPSFSYFDKNEIVCYNSDLIQISGILQKLTQACWADSVYFFKRLLFSLFLWCSMFSTVCQFCFALLYLLIPLGQSFSLKQLMLNLIALFVLIILRENFSNFLKISLLSPDSWLKNPWYCLGSILL